KLLTKRLFLSAAVKKMLVRFVSTLTTSSESCGTSSRVRGVGDGDAFASGVLVWFFANWLRVAIPPHKRRKTRTNKTIGRYCICYFQSVYWMTLSAMAL